MRKFHIIQTIIRNGYENKTHCEEVEDFLKEHENVTVKWLATAGSAYSSIITIFEWDE